MARQENGANLSDWLHNVTSVTSYMTLRFAPLASGPNFGSSDFIGSLRGQSKMTLNGMSSDPYNKVNSLDMILMRLGTHPYFSILVKAVIKQNNLFCHMKLHRSGSEMSFKENIHPPVYKYTLQNLMLDVCLGIPNNVLYILF